MDIFIKVDFSGYDPKYFDKYFKQELIKKLSILGKRLTGKGSVGLKRHLERAGGYAPNSMVWSRGGKGGKRVFYNTGAWRNSVTFMVMPPAADMFSGLRIYFPDSPHPSGGITMSSLAKQLMSGFQYSPSPKQRKAFWAKIDKKALGSNFDYQPKEVWTSPARDYSKFLKSNTIVFMMRNSVKAAADAAVKRSSKRK